MTEKQPIGESLTLNEVLEPLLRGLAGARANGELDWKFKPPTENRPIGGSA